MADQSLSEWVKAMRQMGMPDGQIHSQLSRVGWTDLDISEALSHSQASGDQYMSGPQLAGPQQGFFWGYVSIITSVFFVLYSLFFIFGSPSDWVSKSIYALVSILNVGQIATLIKRKKWAFYCIIPNMILGVALTLMVFQGLFNTINLFLNMFGVTSGIGLSQETLVSLLWWSIIGYIAISLLSNIPWIIYLNNRLTGHFSKPYLALAIGISLLAAAGVIWYEQQSLPISEQMQLQQ